MESNHLSAEVEHLFRHSYGSIVATLMNRFGSNHLESIEDSVQEALLKGMQIWSYRSLPENPTGWLLIVAKNKMIDLLRRNQKMADFNDLEQSTLPSQPTQTHLDHHIEDDQLKMIFACCHPDLSQEYQIILTLKLIGGFHNREVASALLKNEETVAKAFTRAKKKFRECNPSLSIPVELGLTSRLNIVLKTIYLLFTEGYAASSGKESIKKDLCFEAIRLALLLDKNKYCKSPNLWSLLALMSFHTSRFDARVQDGHFVDLENQNRELWNQELIEIGRIYLTKATQGPEQPSDYLFQAFISFYHCTAKDFQSTDWRSILSLYDLKMKHAYTPLTELNRIVPFRQVHGPEASLELLQKYVTKPNAVQNELFHAIQAKLLTDLGRIEEAIQSYSHAIELTQNIIHRNHLIKLKSQIDEKLL